MSTPVVLVLKIIKHIAFIEYKDLKEPHIQNKATFFTTMPHKALRREGVEGGGLQYNHGF